MDHLLIFPMKQIAPTLMDQLQKLKLQILVQIITHCQE